MCIRDRFQQLVADGRIHWFVTGSIGRSNGGSSESSQIEQWVQNTFTRVQVDGIGLYDLTADRTS